MNTRAACVDGSFARSPTDGHLSRSTAEGIGPVRTWGEVVNFAKLSELSSLRATTTSVRVQIILRSFQRIRELHRPHEQTAAREGQQDDHLSPAISWTSPDLPPDATPKKSLPWARRL